MSGGEIWEYALHPENGGVLRPGGGLETWLTELNHRAKMGWEPVTEVTIQPELVDTTELKALVLRRRIPRRLRRKR